MLIMKHFFIKNVKNVTLYHEDNLYFKFYQSMKQNKKTVLISFLVFLILIRTLCILIEQNTNNS